MSPAAMYMICYGSMPDELFRYLIALPLAFIAVVAADWAIDLWRGR